MTLSIAKLTPAIGAEISGVDLSRLSNAEASALHDALMAHQVIFFRDQKMSVEQHKALGRLFGELLVHPAADLSAKLANATLNAQRETALPSRGVERHVR